MKDHRLDDLNSRNLFSHNSESLPAGLVSSEVSLLGFKMTLFSLLSSYGLPYMCDCVLISSSYRYISHIGLGLYPNSPILT